MPSPYRYFFPKRQLREEVDLLPSAISGNEHRFDDGSSDFAVRMLMGYGVARTRSDALRVLQKHQGRGLEQIIKIEHPRRQFWGRFYRAWQRLKAIW